MLHELVSRTEVYKCRNGKKARYSALLLNSMHITLRSISEIFNGSTAIEANLEFNT